MCSIIFSDFFKRDKSYRFRIVQRPIQDSMMRILYGIFFTIWGAKALIIFYPVLKVVIIALFKDRKK